MRTIDYSGMIVMYNFVIGVLISLSSDKLGKYAAVLNSAHGVQLNRLTIVFSRTLGISWAVLSGGVYLAFHVLRLGV
jgi:hypothetical protein